MGGKMEKEVSNNKRKYHYVIRVFLIVFLSLFYLEIVFKYLAFKKIFDLELIRVLLFTVTTSLIISFVFSFFKERTVKMLLFVVTLLSSIYTIIQLNFNSFMGNYMSFNAAGDGLGRVTEEIKPFLLAIKPIYYVCLLPSLLVFISFFFKNKFLKYEKKNYFVILEIIIIILIAHVGSLLTLYLPFFQNANQIKDNKTLYKSPVLIELSLKQFGINRFLVRDIAFLFGEVAEEEIIVVKKPKKIEKKGKIDYTRYIDDTEWEEIIKKEKSNNIKNLHEYYINQNITPKNEMTGIFKDKNLIYIMIEAFDIMAINEEITPTLYKLYTEGIRFDNYYTPKYSCTTGESEYIGLTSIIPSSTVCTPNTYKNNNYETSMFKLFEKSGYYNTSYHNYSDKYYQRTALHENMGSVKFYNNSSLNIKKIWGWPSDLNLMEEAIPYFIDKDKFFSFIITSTTHFPYNEDGHVGVVVTHFDKVKDLPYNIKVKRYMAKAVELDLGIKYLLDSLSEKGILEETVIVLFGDHHPLNLEYKYIDEASPYDRLEDFNINKLPCIIYNSELEPRQVNKTASTFDLLPTLANMFDLDYDPRYYVGKDIFSDEETIVIFTSGSWITDKAMYFSGSGKYKELQPFEEDYKAKINQKVNNYFIASDQTLRLNYFKYRFK